MIYRMSEKCVCHVLLLGLSHIQMLPMPLSRFGGAVIQRDQYIYTVTGGHIGFGAFHFVIFLLLIAVAVVVRLLL